MSDFATAPAVDEAADAVAGPLDADAIERLLAELRAWLAEQIGGGVPPCAEEAAAEDVDLATLLGHFTALRHEVNLQTRASRTQHEQAGQALELLKQALNELEARDRRRDQDKQAAQDDALRPVVKALLDARDSLALAQREVARIAESLASLGPFPDTGAPPELSGAAPPPLAPPPKLHWPWWARLLGLRRRLAAQIDPWEQWLAVQAPRHEALVRWHQELDGSRQALTAARAGAAEQFDQATERLRQSMDSILTGYGMGIQRLERMLDGLGLEPVPCAGAAFDPETMEAVEVVTEPGRDNTLVLDEVRRGYRWRGRVFRCAQVRVARPARA